MICYRYRQNRTSITMDVGLVGSVKLCDNTVYCRPPSNIYLSCSLCWTVNRQRWQNCNRQSTICTTCAIDTYIYYSHSVRIQLFLKSWVNVMQYMATNTGLAFREIGSRRPGMYLRERAYQCHSKHYLLKQSFVKAIEWEPSRIYPFAISSVHLCFHLALIHSFTLVPQGDQSSR